MIKFKKLKSGVVRISDTDNPGTSTDIKTKTEAARRGPTLAQMCLAPNQNKFVKDLEAMFDKEKK